MDVKGSRRWTIAPHACLLHAVWNDEWVCHHALSNDTHRLNGLAGRVLAALAALSPQEEWVLANAVEVDAGIAAEVLDTLESLEFVERSS